MAREGPKQLWLSKDAGLGCAGFSVVGRKLYTMGAIGEGENVLCLDAATGKTLWSRQIDARVYPNNWGDGPRAPPPSTGSTPTPFPRTGSSPACP